MSRPQEPHRTFFPFGNPFRMISPKGSQMSPRLLSLLSAFEQALAERLRKLTPKAKDEVLSLSWMKLAMESLSEVHTDIKTLITELELPVCDWDEKWIDVYLDISIKLLDICIAFSSELSRLNKGHLLLQCALHKLDSSQLKQFEQARASLDSWRQLICAKNPRVGNCFSILDSLVESLNLPKVKNSAKGKVLMRAMYGVKVKTVFVCSVFTAAFTGSAKNLIDLSVPDALPWGKAFSDLQTNVNGEIRNIFSSGKITVLKELDAVDGSIMELYPSVIDGGKAVDVEPFKNSVADMRRRVEDLTQGLDFLIKEVDGFFKIVLTGRDALLCNLRDASSVSNPLPGGNGEEQVVR